jgi:hypothetical protein
MVKLPEQISVYLAILHVKHCDFPKTLLLVSWVKIQYTRDGEGPDL